MCSGTHECVMERAFWNDISLKYFLLFFFFCGGGDGA